MEKKLTRFSLEELQANPKRKVVTDDGRDVRIVCVDRMDGKNRCDKAMTYRDKLTESLEKAGFHKGNYGGLYFKKLVEEQVLIRVISEDYVTNNAEVYNSYSGKSYGDMSYETNCLYALGIEEKARNFGEVCRKAML
jgi:hypothetical protein|nr:MAG TPA: hypothetical protein [Caudoviricetes sp.]